MGITRTTMIDDDGSGTTGTILNNAWLQTIYNQIDADPATAIYAPAWGGTGSAPSLGNGACNGRYTRTGQVVSVIFELFIGSTTALGAGVWTFTLPPFGSPLGPFVLTAELHDSAVGSYAGIATLYSTNQCVFYAAGAPNGVGPSLPFTFKAGDRLKASGLVFYA